MASSTNWRSIINFLAYVALMMIGIALIISSLLKDGSKLAGTLADLATILAYVTVAFCAFSYAEKKWGGNSKRIWYMIAWVVSVVLITLFYIL